MIFRMLSGSENAAAMMRLDLAGFIWSRPAAGWLMKRVAVHCSVRVTLQSFLTALRRTSSSLEIAMLQGTCLDFHKHQRSFYFLPTMPMKPGKGFPSYCRHLEECQMFRISLY